MATTAGIARIETVGVLVRGEHGNLGRIKEVIENSRLTANHVSHPLDVVVRLEPVGPGYNFRSAWASSLSHAEPGDVGSHPHTRTCECVQPYDDSRGGHWGWYDVRQSWD